MWCDPWTAESELAKGAIMESDGGVRPGGQA